MKYLAIASLVVGSAVALAIAIPPSPKTHFMTVEYRKPMRGLEGLQSLDVSFYEPLPPDRMAAILRAQLESCVASFSPTQDVQAFAFNAKDDAVGEPLMYVAKTKAILTQSEYDKSLKK